MLPVALFRDTRYDAFKSLEARFIRLVMLFIFNQGIIQMLDLGLQLRISSLHSNHLVPMLAFQEL